jgi:hypothetical protein
MGCPEHEAIFMMAVAYGSPHGHRTTTAALPSPADEMALLVEVVAEGCVG